MQIWFLVSHHLQMYTEKEKPRLFIEDVVFLFI